MHKLSRNNPLHLWLLHLLFLDSINEDCQDFINTWNHKPIGGTEGANESPANKRYRGEAFQGKYMDDGDDWSIEDLVQYYGTEGEERMRGSNEMGAGQLEDEVVPDLDDDSEFDDAGDDEDSEVDSDLWEDIAQIEESVEHKFAQKPVKLPRWINPLSGLIPTENTPPHFYHT
jgi:hypothetical protein